MELIVKYMTRNDCYVADRTIAPQGIMVHSTATPGVMALTWYDAWNKSGIEKCVHAFVDDKIVMQSLPWNHRGWHCAGSGNNTHISFEICEPRDLSDAEYFAKAYKNAVELTVMLCKEYGLTEQNVVCHCEGYKLGIASNHGDVMHWFPKHGKNMDTFREDVRRGLAGETVVEQPTPQPQPTSTSPIERCRTFVGSRCRELQEKLTKCGYNCGGIDGIFGQNTYNALISFQKDNGLTVDGLAGSNTFAKLDAIIEEMNKPKVIINQRVLAYQKAFNQMGLGHIAEDGIMGNETLGSIAKLPLIKLNSRNAIVAFVQGVVGVGQDGIFGNMTLSAVKSYQSRNGLSADGLVGQMTLKFMITH